MVIDLMTHCQVVSRPFAQDLAEPVEALAPDGGDEVKGGGVGARLFPVCAARQRDEAAAVRGSDLLRRGSADRQKGLNGLLAAMIGGAHAVNTEFDFFCTC